MKIFNTLKLILNNQRGNVDLEGGEDNQGEAENSSEDLSTEGLLASIDSDSENEGESESNTEGQPETEPAEGDDLEARLKGLEVDKSEDNSSLVLEELNKLGILHNGLPIEFEDLEKVKENLSKGFDYTQKTQELSEMRKTADAEIAQERESFESERVAFQEERAQNSEALNNYSAFQSMASEIQKNDPELFEELDSYFTKHQNQIAQENPQVSKLEAKISQLEERLNGNAESEEGKKLGEIKQSWETEVKDLQSSFGPKLRSLGIKPDWSKVKDVWASDTTSKLSVKNALFAEYGEAIEKAMGNKSKLAETRAKVARTGAKPENDGNEETMFGMTSGNSYENEAFEILKEL